LNIKDLMRSEVKIEKYNYNPECVVYYITDESGEIIYIGSTVDIHKRASQHADSVDFSNKPIYITKCTKEECRTLEAKMIYKIKPQFNSKCIHSIGVAGKKTNECLFPGKKTNDIRYKIRKEMKARKYTVSMVANSLRLHRQTVYNLIRKSGGGMQIKTLKYLCLIADLMCVNCDDIKLHIDKSEVIR
jgi:hypothetical protein